MSYLQQLTAHRGASDYAPENTLAAFQVAVDQDVPWLEFDVSLLGDGTPVVMHDDRLDRCSDGKGSIADIGERDLAGIDAGSWFDARFAGERIPLFEQVLEWMEGNAIKVNIELKRHPHQYPPNMTTAEFVQPILDVLSDYPSLYPRCLITSFDSDCLDYCFEQNTGIDLGLLYDAPPADWVKRAQALNAGYLHLHYPEISEQVLIEAAKHNITVRCFTPKKPEQIRHWLDKNLAGVIVNDPLLFMDIPR